MPLSQHIADCEYTQTQRSLVCPKLATPSCPLLQLAAVAMLSQNAGKHCQAKLNATLQQKIPCFSNACHMQRCMHVMCAEVCMMFSMSHRAMQALCSGCLKQSTCIDMQATQQQAAVAKAAEPSRARSKPAKCRACKKPRKGTHEKSGCPTHCMDCEQVLLGCTCVKILSPTDSQYARN